MTELLRIVSESDTWRLVHLASVMATVGGTAAIVAVLWSMMLHGSARWPPVALVSLLLTTPVLLLSVGLDGFAVKSVADRWATAGTGDQQALVAAATALRTADIAVLNLVMITQFGQTAILLDVASWTNDLHGKRLGVVAVARGVVGVLCGSLEALAGRLTSLTFLVLLPVSLALFTIWLLLASIVLWRRAEHVVG